MKFSYRYSGLILFAIILSVVIYVSISYDKEREVRCDSIEINGNKHLESEEYLKYALLDIDYRSSNLSLKIVRDRIQKHPYVKKANIKWDGVSKVVIDLEEKEFSGLLIKENKKFLLTDRLEVLPLIQYTRNVRYPILNNPVLGGSIKLFRSLKDEKEIIKAYHIISAIKIMDNRLYEDLSELDLSDQEKTRLYFSNFNYQIILNDDHKFNKLDALVKLWKYIDNKKLEKYVKYIDMRFADRVYIGLTDGVFEEGGKNI